MHFGRSPTDRRRHTPRRARGPPRSARRRRCASRACAARARAVAIARLVEAHPGAPALVIATGAKATDALLEDLRLALGEPRRAGGRVRPFPRPTPTPYDRFSPQPFVIAQRMDVLHRLASFASG